MEIVNKSEDEEIFLQVLCEEAEITACDPEAVISEVGKKIMCTAIRVRRYAEIACNRELRSIEETRSVLADKEIKVLGDKIGVRFEI